MAFRRRRKSSVLWLPHVAPDNNPDQGWWTGTISAPALSTTAPATQVVALTTDYPMEAVRATQVPSMSDLVDDGYRLRRIVGKAFVALDQTVATVGATYPVLVLIGAGFIVLRVDEETGAPLRLADLTRYSPLELDNTQDPWIWRRAWVLSNPYGTATAISTANGLMGPASNVDYGSASDGPHIDQTTARRVSKEERLFWVISAKTIATGTDAQLVQPADVRWILDYRLLASPMKIMGNRRNASR